MQETNAQPRRAHPKTHFLEIKWRLCVKDDAQDCLILADLVDVSLDTMKRGISSSRA